jgi:tetratricopeptide (TPR) repeat protein
VQRTPLNKLVYFLPLFLLVISSCKKKTPEIRKPDIWVDYRKAEAFAFKQNDSAYYYFNKVVSAFKDSLQVAMALNYMAAMQSDAGDYYGAQETLTQSLHYLNEDNPKDKACLASDFNELGLNATNLKNYQGAIEYFNSAIRFSVDSAYTLDFKNNQANAYQRKKEYAKALKLYREVFQKRTKPDRQYARVLSNIARTKWLADPHYKAAPQLLMALQIREREKDLWGENSSYIHLSEYYADRQPDSALFYARKLYGISQAIHSPDDQLDALSKLVKLAPEQDTKGYFARYERLSDSLQTARYAAKNQFALIRYEAEKSKADNLKLQHDNAEKKYQIIRQQAILGAIILITLAAGLGGVFWYRKRKQGLQMEAERAIRDSQLKTSKKVHDVVANGLYRIMAEIEHQESLDKDNLLDQIELMYEQSRDISYEKEAVPAADFQEKVGDILTSFATAKTKVLVVGNDENTWSGIPAGVRNELQHVLLELMINMKKHSRASNVAVRFGREKETLSITYTDDGTGLPKQHVFGNGLASTTNRIQTIHGEINMENRQPKGLQIRIFVPVQSK